MTIPVVTPINDDAVQIVWANMTDDDDAEPYTGASQYDDRSVQVTGDIDGGTVAFKGSNDGANFATLTDGVSSLGTLSSGALKQVYEYTYSFKPVLNSPGAAADVTITVVAKRKRT